MSMFSNCTSLTQAPELPAEVLAEECYDSMFAFCSSLKTAPALPVTTLAVRCYSYMFRACTSLKTAPELPAEALVEKCYEGMFFHSGNLSSIKVAFTNWNENVRATSSWLAGTGSGKFTCPDGLDLSKKDDDHFPSAWTRATN